MHLGWLHHILEWMRAIQQAGIFGWCLFIGSYALFCVLFLPGSLLTIAAGAVYGFWVGCALVLLGNGLGAALCLLIARYFLRDWAARRVAKYPGLKILKKVVAHEDMKLVFLSHLSPIMPFSLINFALGLTDISLWRFLAATELGAIPATVVYVYIGMLAGNLARIAPEIKQHRPMEWTLQGIGLVLAIGITAYLTRLAQLALKNKLG